MFKIKNFVITLIAGVILLTPGLRAAQEPPGHKLEIPITYSSSPPNDLKELVAAKFFDECYSSKENEEKHQKLMDASDSIEIRIQPKNFGIYHNIFRFRTITLTNNYYPEEHLHRDKNLLPIACFSQEKVKSALMDVTNKYINEIYDFPENLIEIIIEFIPDRCTKHCVYKLPSPITSDVRPKTRYLNDYVCIEKNPCNEKMLRDEVINKKGIPLEQLVIYNSRGKIVQKNANTDNANTEIKKGSVHFWTYNVKQLSFKQNIYFGNYQGNPLSEPLWVFRRDRNDKALSLKAHITTILFDSFNIVETEKMFDIKKYTLSYEDKAYPITIDSASTMITIHTDSPEPVSTSQYENGVPIGNSGINRNFQQSPTTSLLGRNSVFIFIAIIVSSIAFVYKMKKRAKTQKRLLKKKKFNKKRSSSISKRRKIRRLAM